MNDQQDLGRADQLIRHINLLSTSVQRDLLTKCGGSPDSTLTLGPDIIATLGNNGQHIVSLINNMRVPEIPAYVKALASTMPGLYYMSARNMLLWLNLVEVNPGEYTPVEYSTFEGHTVYAGSDALTNKTFSVIHKRSDLYPFVTMTPESRAVCLALIEHYATHKEETDVQSKGEPENRV